METTLLIMKFLVCASALVVALMLLQNIKDEKNEKNNQEQKGIYPD